MVEDNNEFVKARFFYEAAIESYALINESNNHLDKKAHDTLMFVSAMVPITVGLIYFVIESIPLNREIIYSNPFIFMITMLIFSLFFFIVSLILLIFLYLPKEFKRINPAKLIDKYKDKTLKESLQTLSATVASISEENKEICNQKANILKWAQIFILVGIITLFLSVISLLLTFYSITIDCF